MVSEVVQPVREEHGLGGQPLHLGSEAEGRTVREVLTIDPDARIGWDLKQNCDGGVDVESAEGLGVA